MNENMNLAEIFAAIDNPRSVGRKAGWLLDNTDLPAGDIEAAKQTRLEETRSGKEYTTGNAIDSQIRRNNAARRLR